MTDTQAPEHIYLDADAEAGDGSFSRCFEQPKYCSEPAIEYERRDLADARAAAAAQAMRDAAAQPSYDMAEAFRKVAQHPDAKANTALDLAVIHKAIADKITALPLPDTAALDRLIAERVREAVEAEREACAKVIDARCEALFGDSLEDNPTEGQLVNCAFLIRARGSKEGR